MGEYSLSDINAAVNGGNYRNYGYGDGMFGGNGIWFLALMFLFGGGFGGYGWGNRGGGAPVTEADLCNANSFNDLKSGVRDLSGQISSMNVGFTKGLCDMGYTIMNQFNALERQLAQCCCEIQRSLDAVNYNVAQQASSIKFDMANYAAATNQMFNAGIQSVKDMFRDYQEQNLRDQNMKSYIDGKFCGVVRYPTATTYATNCNPFFGAQGCCNGYCG